MPIVRRSTRCIVITRLLLSLALIASPLIHAGCPIFVAGVVAGAGAFTYIQGELKRTYPANFDSAVTACKEALDSLEITITEENSGDTRTMIAGKQANGTPLTVKLEMVGLDITEISVRTGSLGVWNKDVSELIHASIAHRL
jgi:uncharacterized protein DUF3568